MTTELSTQYCKLGSELTFENFCLGDGCERVAAHSHMKILKRQLLSQFCIVK